MTDEACKVKNAVYGKQYRAAHHDRLLIQTRDWITKHHQHKIELDRIYHAAHKEEAKVQVRASYLEHRTQRIAYADKWAKEHPERQREYNRTKRLKNPEQVRERWRRWFANKKAGCKAENPLTLTEWEEIKTEFNQACAYCEATGVPLTQDHVLPLSRGGLHTKENVVPACRHCNSSKGNRTPEEWRNSIVTQ